MSNWYNIPNDFDVKIYISLHSDLTHLNENEAMHHYENYGFYENRRYLPIPKDFDYKVYIELNPDLHNTDENTAKFHYENYGYFENRKYKRETETQVQPAIPSLINHFLKIYNTEMLQFRTDPKVKFRYFCFKYINYIRNITLPAFKEVSNFEAVLVEFRCFPHLEFIIRNNILKLCIRYLFTYFSKNKNYSCKL